MEIQLSLESLPLVPNTRPVEEQGLPAGQTPLLCLGLAEVLPVSMVPYS